MNYYSKKMLIIFITFSILYFNCLNGNSTTSNEKKTKQNESTLVQKVTIVEKNNLAKTFYAHLKGKIKNSEMEIDLSKWDNTLSGNCFDNREKKSWNLSGIMQKDSTFQIVQTDYKTNVIWYWNGKLLNNNTLIGIRHNSDSTISEKFKFTEEYSNSVKFKSLSLQSKYNMFDKENMPTCSIELHFLQPIVYKNDISLKSLQESFNSTFFGKTENTNPDDLLKQKVDELIQFYKETNETDFDSSMIFMYNWEHVISNNIQFNSLNLLSIGELSYEYTGGAHGMGGTSYAVYNLQNFCQIKLSDIFIENFTNPLTKKIIEHLKYSLSVKTTEELSEILFDINDIKPNENFYINRTGICFHYNPYEIAPYAIGEIEVFIPFTELKTILKQSSSISHLF